MDTKFTSQQFNDILNSLSEGIIISDLSGNIIFCNENAVNNYETTFHKLLNHNINYLLKEHLIDQSFHDLCVSTKKAITYEQLSKSKKRLINRTIPYFDQSDHLKYVIQQTLPSNRLEFNTPNTSAGKHESETAINTKKSASEEYIVMDFKSKAMVNIYNLADNMAPKNINILILGDSGTGKSQLAKRIHNNSQRKNEPFVTINCSTIPENLLESELFGYVKGAFSGANEKGKQGLVESADKGTIFLDEIGELPMSIQSKLLQLVQEKTYLPIGEVHPKQVDIRIIAATNQNLSEQINTGLFREDLYYRLAVVTITIPPLKSRPEDVKALINHFTHVFNHKHNTDTLFSKPALDALVNYSWPGNIRELEHLVEFLILNTTDGYITPYMLPANIVNPSEETSPINNTELPPENSKNDLDLYDSLNSYKEDCESEFIKYLYPKYPSSYKLASRLKISQSKANKLIQKYILK